MSYKQLSANRVSFKKAKKKNKKRERRNAHCIIFGLIYLDFMTPRDVFQKCVGECLVHLSENVAVICCC